MDISKLSHGAKLIIGGTVAFLIVSIFNWQEVDISGIASVGRSMWHGWGVLAGLLAIALLVWEVIRLANINVAMPVTPAMTSAALAVLLAIFTVIKFLADNEFRTFWAWLGLILAIAIVVGAWLNMQAAGEGLADIRTQVGSAASAAKGAVDRDDKPASSGRARTGGADAGRAEHTALRPAARSRGAENGPHVALCQALLSRDARERSAATLSAWPRSARCGSRRALPRCSRAASSWTSSTPSRRGSRRTRAPAR